MFAFSTVSSFFVATAWNMPAKIATEPISLVYFVGIALLSTMLAYAFYAAGLKTVSAGKASMISTLEIAVATAVGIIRFGVIPGVWGFVGIALTVLSLVFMQIKDVKTAVVAKSETKSAVLFKAEETVFSEGTAGGLGGESVRVSAAHDKKE